MSVTVFVADGCPYCRALLDDLARRHVAFRRIDLSREPHRVAQLAALTRERRVPVTVDHEVCSVGFRGQSSALAALGVR